MEQDTKAAKKSRDRAQAAAGGGVGLLQSFFFNKKPTHPVPATPANPAATPRVGQRSDGSRDAGSSGGKLSPTATSRGSREGARKLIKQAVPNDFAGRSWDGYLHHVKFLVALLHVGTSLMPKNLIKVRAWRRRQQRRLFFPQGLAGGGGIFIYCLPQSLCTHDHA